jgi:hypothetical protein
LSPIVRTVRADDAKGKDEDVDSPINGKGGGDQPKPPPKTGSSPLNRRDPAEAGRHSADGDDGHEEKERKMADDEVPSWAKQLTDAVAGVAKRLDAIEKGRGDSGNEDNPPDGPPLGPEDGIPRALAADAERVHKESFGWRKKHDLLNKITCRSDTQDLFTKFQSRADQIYGYHGMSAERPVHGEELSAYRRRLLNPFKHLSAAFKHSDLRVLAVDPQAFQTAEDTIYAAAEQEGRNPQTVPLGILREHTETKHGHLHTKFYGRPKSWMTQFMHQGKRVKQIIERNDHGPHRTIYEAKY